MIFTEQLDIYSTDSFYYLANGIYDLASKPEEVTDKQDVKYDSKERLINENNSSEVNVTNPDNKTMPKFITNLKPVFLNEHQRKFANPISYLGGPRLPSRNRWSVESVVSLD